MTEKYEVRGVFRKFGRAVYISHLDLFRTMQRAMKRSKIPVWYSEGFNPRIYLNFPLALALGVESDCEVMDFKMVEKMPYDEMLAALNRVLPEGLEFVSMSAPIAKNQDIGFSEYEFTLFGNPADELLSGFDKMMNRESIVTHKHSKKKGLIDIDIKPHISVLSEQAYVNRVILTVRLPAGQDFNINSNVFCDALKSYMNIPKLAVSTKRTKILNKNGEMFV